MLSETGISDEAMQNQGADEVLAGFNKVDLHPDVAPALAEIRACQMQASP